MKAFIAFALLLAAVPVHADAFTLRGNIEAMQLAPLATSDGSVVNCPCGPAVETFDAAFDFDTVSHAVANMTFDSNGALGPFTFKGVTAGTGVSDFTWSSSMASIVLNVYDQYFGAGFLPSHSLTLACLNAVCVDDFGGASPSFFNDLGTASSTPTPEPSTLLLLGVGLTSIVLLGRKMLIASLR